MLTPVLNRATPPDNSTLHTWSCWLRAAGYIVGAVGKLPAWAMVSHEIDSRHQLASDFIGVNVGTSSDPKCDDYVVAALRDLQLQQVRMDYSYCSDGGDAQRLLDRLLDEGFDVVLDVLPPAPEAASLSRDSAASQRWRAFVASVFRNYGDRVSTFEIGATPNRGRWSGFSVTSYLEAWRVAATEAEQYSVELAGPNVSDFEPFYSMGFLKAMSWLHSTPTVHTNNLFAERAVQPEAYDHRALGSWAGKILKLNLVKKARVIASISRELDIKKTYCTYTCWTRTRLARWNSNPEQAHANYLVRYLVMAAASGALDRVYWGPLICSRDGLIHCGADDYPKIDNVSFYRSVRGAVEDFKPTLAYKAFKHAVGLLKNVTCLGGVSAENGISHYMFETALGGEFHVVWCLDRYVLPLDDIYPAGALDGAEFFDTLGEPFNDRPFVVTERPVVIHWPVADGVYRPGAAELTAIEDVSADGVVYRPSSTRQPMKVATNEWRGTVAVARGGDPAASLERYMPDNIKRAGTEQVLRDKRNRLWNVKLEGSEALQTVKLNRTKGIKRLSYRFRPSKGKRHWNNAVEMLRRGVNTPEPLAFFERPWNSGVEDNYYVASFLEGAFSCRDVFTAFARGDTEYRGREKRFWLERIAAFVSHMHKRRVIHNDLSSGNILMTDVDGQVELYVIDIGRAVIYAPIPDRMKTRHRMSDVRRICYKLSPADRETFVVAYRDFANWYLPPWWRSSLGSYDLKQKAKKVLLRRFRKAGRR